jgi:hypothetical protein
MRKYRIKISIFGAILISLILYTSISVSAQPYWADGGYMITEASNNPPLARAVANDDEIDITRTGEVGPDVIINVSCYAWDNSTGNSLGSYHEFNLTAEHLGRYYYDQWDTTLSGQSSDTHTLQAILKDVWEGVVNTTLSCEVIDYDTLLSDDDTDYGTITLT